MTKQTQIILAIIATAVIAFGAGFFTARQLRANQKQIPRVGQNRQQGGFRPIAGEIISSDDKSITVKLTDGSSKIVLVTDKTTFNKAAEATKADLKNGVTVSVFGTESVDGSVTAQNIQLK